MVIVLIQLKVEEKNMIMLKVGKLIDKENKNNLVKHFYFLPNKC